MGYEARILECKAKIDVLRLRCDCRSSLCKQQNLCVHINYQRLTRKDFALSNDNIRLFVGPSFRVIPRLVVQLVEPLNAMGTSHRTTRHTYRKQVLRWIWKKAERIMSFSRSVRLGQRYTSWCETLHNSNVEWRVFRRLPKSCWKIRIVDRFIQMIGVEFGECDRCTSQLQQQQQ